MIYNWKLREFVLYHQANGSPYRLLSSYGDNCFGEGEIPNSPGRISSRNSIFDRRGTSQMRSTAIVCLTILFDFYSRDRNKITKLNFGEIWLYSKAQFI